MKTYNRCIYVAIVVYVYSQMPLLASYWSQDADRDLAEYGFKEVHEPEGVRIFTIILAICIVFFHYVKEGDKPQGKEWYSMLIWFPFATLMLYGLLVYPVWGIYTLLNYLF